MWRGLRVDRPISHGDADAHDVGSDCLCSSLARTFSCGDRVLELSSPFISVIEETIVMVASVLLDAMDVFLARRLSRVPDDKGTGLYVELAHRLSKCESSRISISWISTCAAALKPATIDKGNESVYAGRSMIADSGDPRLLSKYDVDGHHRSSGLLPLEKYTPKDHTGNVTGSGHLATPPKPPGRGLTGAIQLRLALLNNQAGRLLRSSGAALTAIAKSTGAEVHLPPLPPGWGLGRKKKPLRVLHLSGLPSVVATAAGDIAALVTYLDDRGVTSGNGVDVVTERSIPNNDAFRVQMDAAADASGLYRPCSNEQLDSPGPTDENTAPAPLPPRGPYPLESFFPIHLLVR